VTREIATVLSPRTQEVLKRMQAKQAATAVVVSLALPIVLAAPAEAAPYLHLSNSAPSKLALSSVPRTYLSWYQQAARTCQGLPWPVLAGIGEMESDHGQSTAPGVHSAANFAGAEGPMQFEPGTFAAFAVRADRSRALSPYDPQDAIYTAAHMLCADGARGGSPSGITSALFAYNHADWYPPHVMSWAAKYATDRAVLVRAPHRRSIEVHVVTPRRARRVTVARHIAAPRTIAGPHTIKAPRSLEAPHLIRAPHAIKAPHLVETPHTAEAPHGAARHTATPKPTQTANPLAPTPAPIATPSVTPLGSPTATPSASAAQPAPGPSGSQPAPTPSATVPPAPSVTQPSAPAPQPTPSPLSADAQQLAAEAQQLSAEARQLSNEAQQLSAEAQQMTDQHGAAPVTLVQGPSVPIQAQPTPPSATAPVSPSAGTPSAGTPSAGTPSAEGPSAEGPSPVGSSATAGADQQ
jgi:hypothetical protein